MSLSSESTPCVSPEQAKRAGGSAQTWSAFGHASLTFLICKMEQIVGPHFERVVESNAFERGCMRMF